MKRNVKTIFIIFILVNLFFIFFNIYFVFATDVDDLIQAVEPNVHAVDPQGHGWAVTINKGITILQVTGTGVAVIAVTLLGGKYIMASPSEKAETKKLILPIIIGCVLVFGAVNIVAIIVKFSDIFNGL